MEISTVKKTYIYLGPWGSQVRKSLAWGEAGPRPGISLAWGPGQRPKKRNINTPETPSTDVTNVPIRLSYGHFVIDQLANE